MSTDYNKLLREEFTHKIEEQGLTARDEKEMVTQLDAAYHHLIEVLASIGMGDFDRLFFIEADEKQNEAVAAVIDRYLLEKERIV